VAATPAKIHRTAPFVEFSPPSIGPAEIGEVVAALESGWLSTGPRVKRFETAFAEYVGSPHAVAVNSCTAALHLSLLAARIGEGDEVITTPLTFCATANVIVHAGATPVFADIDPVTMNLTPESAARAVTPRTRAIIPVHYAGRPVDAAGFRDVAARHRLMVIEDAAHAIEAVSDGAKIGTTGDLTCFSFYATKNLTTGEGGMVTTASEEWASRIRTAALHGLTRDAWGRYGRDQPARYEVALAGFKYNMSDLQAAIGIHQLSGLEERLTRREAVWKRYDAGLRNFPIERPAAVGGRDRHARHLYTILVDEARCGYTRDALQLALYERGVATSVHFVAVHLQPYYQQEFGFRRGLCPIAEAISDRTLSLPLSAAITNDDVDHVIETLGTLIG
jgi:dTDP-4-amino-4,6-dideoxygalactose transaminase